MEDYIKEKFEEIFNADEGYDLAKMPSGNYNNFDTAAAFHAFRKGFLECKKCVTVTRYKDDPVAVSLTTEDHEMFHIIWCRVDDDEISV